MFRAPKAKSILAGDNRAGGAGAALTAAKTAAEPLEVKQLRAEASRGGEDQGLRVCAWWAWGLVHCQGREKCDMVPSLCLV